jgi:hypothetical protein
MRFAMYVPNFDTFGSIQTLIELAQAAERAGWDGFFLWDHLLPDADSAHGPVADPWIALTAMAGATNHLRLGPLVTPLPRRRPWKVARESAARRLRCRHRARDSRGAQGSGGAGSGLCARPAADPRLLLKTNCCS